MFYNVKDNYLGMIFYNNKMSNSKENNSCSFCGRSEEEVEVLINGVDAFICNNCIDQAQNILDLQIEENKESATVELD